MSRRRTADLYSEFTETITDNQEDFNDPSRRWQSASWSGTVRAARRFDVVPRSVFRAAAREGRMPDLRAADLLEDLNSTASLGLTNALRFNLLVTFH
jgi:hypothetical protein